MTSSRTSDVLSTARPGGRGAPAKGARLLGSGRRQRGHTQRTPRPAAAVLSAWGVVSALLTGSSPNSQSRCNHFCLQSKPVLGTWPARASVSLFITWGW